MAETATGPTVSLEGAQPVEEDARLVMAWRNDEVTRAMSFHREEKTWDTFWPAYRDTYFRAVPLPPMFAVHEGRRVGLVRFRAYEDDSVPGRAVDIGIMVAPSSRGRGLGTAILVAATREALAGEVDTVVAEIRPENASSVRAFEKAGYRAFDQVRKTVEDTGETLVILRYVAQRPYPPPSAAAGRLFVDFDGTLADSLDALFAAYREFLARWDHPATRAEFDRLNGPTLAEIVARLKAEKDLPGSEEDLLEIYRGGLAQAYRTAVAPAPGALDFLHRLSRRGVEVAVVTSGPGDHVRAFVARAGLEGIFAAIVSGDDVAEGKPSPAVYEAALRRLGWPPASVVALEDSPLGVRAARAAGVRVIGLARAHDPAVLEAAGAFATVRDFDEVLPLLDEVRHAAP